MPKYREIVINNQYGGYNENCKAVKEKLKEYGYTGEHIERDNKYLVKVAKEFKNLDHSKCEVDGHKLCKYYNLIVVKIPADITWNISEYENLIETIRRQKATNTLPDYERGRKFVMAQAMSFAKKYWDIIDEALLNETKKTKL